MENRTTQGLPELELLSEFRLQYEKSQPRVTLGDPRVGSYLGSGTGTARGSLLSGKIRWDLFEARSETFCAADFRGQVDAEDGVAVEFECIGFFRRPSSNEMVWTMSGSVFFRSQHARFSSLTERPAVWEGAFDMSTHTHRYLVYRANRRT